MDMRTEKERRKYPRKKVMLPVVLHNCDANRYFYYSGIITDISLGGLYIEMSEKSSRRVKREQINQELEILFKPPNFSFPIGMKCKVCRMDHTDYGLRIGVFFDGNQNDNRNLLKKYVIL